MCACVVSGAISIVSIDRVDVQQGHGRLRLVDTGNHIYVLVLFVENSTQLDRCKGLSASCPRLGWVPSSF